MVCSQQIIRRRTPLASLQYPHSSPLPLKYSSYARLTLGKLVLYGTRLPCYLQELLKRLAKLYVLLHHFILLPHLPLQFIHQTHSRNYINIAKHCIDGTLEITMFTQVQDQVLFVLVCFSTPHHPFLFSQSLPLFSLLSCIIDSLAYVYYLREIQCIATREENIPRRRTNKR